MTELRGRKRIINRGMAWPPKKRTADAAKPLVLVPVGSDVLVAATDEPSAAGAVLIDVPLPPALVVPQIFNPLADALSAEQEARATSIEAPAPACLPIAAADEPLLSTESAGAVSVEPEPAAAVFIELPPQPTESVSVEKAPERESQEQVETEPDKVTKLATCAPMPLVSSLNQVQHDCFRCSSTRDGLWHTFALVVPFYETLFAISEARQESNAEERWYAALARAGIVRGEECSALQWPLSDAAAHTQTAKVHGLARLLLSLLCSTAIRQSTSAFVDQILVPSLLCLHEQALQNHATLRAAEASLELEDLRGELEQAALDAVAHDITAIRNALAWSQPMSVLAQLCCAVVGAPSRGMTCAYQCAKPAPTAFELMQVQAQHAVNLPPLPLAALPLNLRRSMECERTSDGFFISRSADTRLSTKEYQQLYDGAQIYFD